MLGPGLQSPGKKLLNHQTTDYVSSGFSGRTPERIGHMVWSDMTPCQRLQSKTGGRVHVGGEVADKNGCEASEL